MRAAFFDLDGCLVDSRVPISGAMNAALVELGLPERPPEQLHGYIGPPLLASFTEILTELDADPGLAESAIAAYRRVYPELSLSQTQLVPGIVEVLDALHGDVTLMVVTSKPREYAEPIVDALGLGGHVEAVFGPALDALTEPKATQLERAIRLAEVPDGDRRTAATMIGDREHDVIAGVACGVRTVGVTWGIGDAAELWAAGADVVVDRPAELLDL